MTGWPSHRSRSLVRPGGRLEHDRAFEFVEAHQADHPVATLCRLLGVSRSGFYAWQKRPPSDRERANARLTEEFREIHTWSRGTYGAPRVHAELRARGHRVGKNRVARLMRQAGLRGVSRRRPVTNTRRREDARPAPDLVDRDFEVSAPDRLWVADITYVPTAAGFFYLSVVLDAWSRRVVGWSMATHLKTKLVLDALEMAIHQRRPDGVVHHSDQGTQYTSLALGKRCREEGVRPSMGSVGDAYDNALCESFFASLECELIDRVSLTSFTHGRRKVFDYIEGWHNPHRRHSSLEYESPINYERRSLLAA